MVTAADAGQGGEDSGSLYAPRIADKQGILAVMKKSA